jgi:hypothetical protein
MTDMEHKSESEHEHKSESEHEDKSESEHEDKSESGSGSESGTDSDSGEGSENEQRLHNYINDTLENAIVMDTMWHVLKMYMVAIIVLYLYIIMFRE